MPIPDTLSKIRLAGDIRHPQTGAPGTGRVEIEFGYAIRDTGNNVIFGPGIVTADVANGVFVTDEMVNPRQAGVSPTNQPLTVRVLTDVHASEYRIEIPADTSGTVQLVDLAPATDPPAVVTYALASQLADYLPKTGGTVTGAITWNGTPSASGHFATKAYVDGLMLGFADTRLTGPLFCPEDYGDPVGDGVADDYAPVTAAWDAMLAYPLGRGRLLIPATKMYRLDLSNAARVGVTGDKARASLPLPQVARTAAKRAYGIVSAGEAYVVRTAELGGAPAQVNTCGGLFFDTGATTYTWSSTLGLPCAIGGPDADMTDPVGNSFSNIHFSIENVILRQTDNPSLCTVNLEQISTCRVDNVRIDVESVLDDIPLPTNPTGCALLLPRTNNNVAITVNRLITEGYYAGVPLTEHIECGTAIALRCRIAVHNRRACSHPGLVRHLKTEQCTWGISGYDPSAAGPDDGVVPCTGWTGRIDFWGIEDYANLGASPGFYTPTAGAHVNDEGGVLNGTIAFLTRVNSEPPDPGGIGIGPGGMSQSLYVIGPNGTDSPIAIYGADHTVAATRLAPPSGPVITEYRLFGSTNGPDTSETDNNQPINLGVEIAPSAAVNATKLHFYRGTTDITGAITGRLWRITGPGTGEFVTGSDVTFTLSGTGWHTATFTNPIALSSADRYIATVHFPDRWPFTAGYWGDLGPGSGGIVNGPLRAFSNFDSLGGQGRFSSGAVTVFPASSGNASNYWVDITVVAA